MTSLEERIIEECKEHYIQEYFSGNLDTEEKRVRFLSDWLEMKKDLYAALKVTMDEGE